ncbi:MAG: radical SAM protein, partial [Ruminococcus sp.]|nr:radical SAM protein [Ruminococcus sp.]
MNCIYCFNKEQRMARLNSENYKTLSLCEICNAILQFKDLGGNRVVLTGGEPTLNENFEKICKFIHEQGLESSFITNGLTLLHKSLNEILPYITSIGLSLDSVFNDELNTLWGIHNDRISHNMLAVLKKLDDWSRDNNQITINIMPISSKVNYQSMAEIIHTIAVSLSHCNVTWQIVKYDKIDN